MGFSMHYLKRTTWIFLLLLALAWGTANAATKAIWPAEAIIEFDATSTLHDFTGAVTPAPFNVRVLWNGPLVTVGGKATVAVASMNTKHVKRDRNMRKMFHSDTFPLLSGVMKPVQINPDDLKSVPLDLTVLGTTRTVPLTLSQWQVDDDGIHFGGTLSLSLKELGLKPPVIMGFIRVGDSVEVRIHGTLKKPSK